MLQKLKRRVVLFVSLLFLMTGSFLYSETKNLEIKPFARDGFETLKIKKSKKKNLVVHIFVPLCDNEHQGIVPVSKILGNGLDLRNNLYWGALYGVKTHLKRSKKWKLIYDKKNISDVVLERVIFKRDNVYIVADAYRGDKMKETLFDYFDSISGVKSAKVALKKESLALYKDADLTIFNGHNGLMDYSIKAKKNEDNKTRETAVIGCKSYKYFKSNLLIAKAYPLVTTTNYMAPEAYVLEAIVNSWGRLESEKSMKKSAGKAYNKYQKCGLRGATRLFQDGWKREK